MPQSEQMTEPRFLASHGPHRHCLKNKKPYLWLLPGLSPCAKIKQRNFTCWMLHKVSQQNFYLIKIFPIYFYYSK